MGSNDSFPSAARLKTKSEFARVFERRCSVADDVLIVYAVEREIEEPAAAPSRLGLAVSKRVGNAVRRNRWKRCIREAFRRQREKLPAGLDFVVLPRPTAAPQNPQVARSLRRLAGRVHRKLQRKPT